MFLIISFILIFSAIMVITGKHILHSAFYLAATLLCVAMYFIMLRAEFLAAVQVLVYIGSIVVLILFALMLTRTKVGQDTNISNNQKVFAALTAILLFISLTLVFSYSKIDTVAENTTALKISSIKDFSGILFTKYTLPFEIASILLLASLVGSIVIAMKEKQETGVETVIEHGSTGVSNTVNQIIENTIVQPDDIMQGTHVEQSIKGEQGIQDVDADKYIDSNLTESMETKPKESAAGTLENASGDYQDGKGIEDKKGKN